MNKRTAGDRSVGAGPFTIYSAGGLFTQDELTTNIMLKEAVWRLSGGKFQFFLPQSREIESLDRPDVVAYIRNTDLADMISADIVLARFDGLELDSGTVVEYIVAKTLGKPTVILRTDFRRMGGTGFAEPYNLMAKNWPRNKEILIDSYQLWAGIFPGERRAQAAGDPAQALMQAELGTFQKSLDELAGKVVAAMEAVLLEESPYPPEYQEAVYRAFRFAPGSGFDAMFTEGSVDELIARLRNNGTL